MAIRRSSSDRSPLTTSIWATLNQVLVFSVGLQGRARPLIGEPSSCGYRMYFQRSVLNAHVRCVRNHAHSCTRSKNCFANPSHHPEPVVSAVAVNLFSGCAPHMSRIAGAKSIVAVIWGMTFPCSVRPGYRTTSGMNRRFARFVCRPFHVLLRANRYPK